MRKYIVGGLFGFLLSFGFGAQAQVSSMINQLVEGTFPVTVEGKRLETDAVVIQGSTYLPVRAFGEAIGYDVGFDSELGVSLEPKEGEKLVTEPPADTTTTTETPSAEESTPAQTYKQWYDGKMLQSAELREQSEALQEKITSLTPILIPYEQAMVTKDSIGTKDKDDLYYKTKEEVETLSAQRDALDAQWHAITREIVERAKQEREKQKAQTQTP
jgi:hypothetical protein